MVAEACFTNDSSIQYMWDHITSDTYKVVIHGSTHYTYMDMGGPLVASRSIDSPEDTVVWSHCARNE